MDESTCEQSTLFRAGEGGYHTYRIPSLVLTQAGTILAFCEARKHSSADDGDIDLVLRRSSDGGRTWDPVQMVWDDGENTVGNPCPVLDGETGTVWLLLCRNNDQVLVMHSDDDGATWSTPQDITAAVKPQGWTWYATGPGHGIQLRSGRLLIPCDHQAGPVHYSHVIYSDDHGRTWQVGGRVAERTDECTAVELTDGRVYLNMRSYHERDRRAVAWSTDGGESWSDIAFDEALVEPVCQAAVMRLTTKERGRSRVLFCNPASRTRDHLTVRISYDECQTWQTGKVLQEGPAAYCDLCVAPDGSILCLYERGEQHPYETLTLARFSLQWLTDGTDCL